jgi:transcriptional regulator with XRE-family HTH domain
MIQAYISLLFYYFSDTIRAGGQMKGRLKTIRNTLKLDQSEFAAKLGMKQTGYSRIETGANALTEQNIRLICLTFGVNENWLRTGTGDMFITKDLAETPEEKELLGIFRRLSVEMREFFLDMGRKLTKTGSKQAETSISDTTKNVPGGATLPLEASQEGERQKSAEAEKGERRADTSEKPV